MEHVRPVARIWKEGVHFWCQLTEGSVCVTPIFQLGVWGALQAFQRQTHFDNNLLKIGLKSGL